WRSLRLWARLTSEEPETLALWFRSNRFIVDNLVALLGTLLVSDSGLVGRRVLVLCRVLLGHSACVLVALHVLHIDWLKLDVVINRRLGCKLLCPHFAATAPTGIFGTARGMQRYL